MMISVNKSQFFKEKTTTMHRCTFTLRRLFGTGTISTHDGDMKNNRILVEISLFPSCYCPPQNYE